MKKTSHNPGKRPSRPSGKSAGKPGGRTGGKKSTGAHRDDRPFQKRDSAGSKERRFERRDERKPKPAYGKTFDQKFTQRDREDRSTRKPSSRGERPREERHERPARFDRAERPAREERGNRPQQAFGKPFARKDNRKPDGQDERRNFSRDRAARQPAGGYERSERPARAERPARSYDRPERAERPAHAERSESRMQDRPSGRATRKPGFDKAAPKAPKPNVRFGVKPQPAPRKPAAAAAESAHEGERIAKRLARAGVASRREIERMIEARRIKVNGRVLDSPALNVTDSDVIVVDGNIISAREPTRLFRYHKPAGIVTTASDPQGRPTVFEQLPKELGRVISVGRLDLNTEGLLLLTNNGELSRHLELPSTGWTRRYRVRVHGLVDPRKLELLAQGVEYEGVPYGPVIATIEQAQDRANVWIDVAIKEGKNREIRNVMRAIDLEVNRLIRVSYGPFQLGNLPSGAIEAVPARVLREQFGNVIEL